MLDILLPRVARVIPLRRTLLLRATAHARRHVAASLSQYSDTEAMIQETGKLAAPGVPI